MEQQNSLWYAPPENKNRVNRVILGDEKADIHNLDEIRLTYELKQNNCIFQEQ